MSSADFPDSPFDVFTCARPNILSLKPYRCARDDYKDDGTNVLLDANENAYGPSLALKPARPSTAAFTNGHSEAALDDQGFSFESSESLLRGLNRYPDPHQTELKSHLCTLRQLPNSTPPLTPSNLFVGVGSDEAIDALFRAFCRPGLDKILTCPPTYGMYDVSACVNDVAVEHVPLDPEHEFALDVPAISARLSEDASQPEGAGRIKLIYLCTPGNPTGHLLPPERIAQLLSHPSYNGLVVLDEAYVDFSAPNSSLASWVTRYPNLVVLQTLSKCFGLAGIRLGAAFCSPPVAQLLNNLKAPYNVSSVTSHIAIRALSDPKHLAVMHANRARILSQRDRLCTELPRIPGVGRFRGGFDSNFLLVEFLDRPLGSDQVKVGAASPDNKAALAVYEALAETCGVVVRFRGKEYGCNGCLRITVGTDEEVDRFLTELKSVLQGIYASRESEVQQHLNSGNAATENIEQQQSNAIP